MFSSVKLHIHQPEPPGPSKILAAALLTTLLPASASLARDKKTFSDSTTVAVVEVPVNVTRDGAPVRGLSAGDFIVLDEGTRRELLSFEVVDLAAPSAMTSRPASPASANVPVPARRHFLLLFDLSYSKRERLVHAATAARQVLTGLHPSDLVGVGVFGQAQGARMLVSFTPDHGQAEKAIAGFEAFLNSGPPSDENTTAKNEGELTDKTRRKRDPLGLVAADSKTLAADIGRTAGEEITAALDALRNLAGGGSRGADIMADTLASMNIVASNELESRRRDEIRTLTDSLGQLATATAGLDGRKYLLLFSEGFDSSLLYGEGGSRAQAAVNKMTKQFRRAGWNIQSVDPGGVRDNWNTWDGSDSLTMMARDTGGDLYQNFNDLGDAMGQMLDKTSVTYLLTFQAENIPMNGAFRDLKIRLADGKRRAEVSHRAGYFAPSADGQSDALAASFSSAELILAGEEGGDLELPILTMPFKGEDGEARIGVWLAADGEELLAGHESPSTRIEVFAYALDSHGEIHDFFSRSLGLDLAKVGEDLRSAGLKIYGDLSLPAGHYDLRLLLRVAETNRWALRRRPLEVPSLETGLPSLLPPLFLAAPTDRALVARQPDPADPFQIAGRPIAPVLPTELGSQEVARVALLGYHLGTDLQLDARVERDAAAVDGVGLRVIGRGETAEDGRGELYFELDPSHLEPGEHTLRITVSDPSSGARATSATAFVVAEH